MESLSDTIWDVVICGTGLRQSLLALALSRSGKKILHIDRNKYYGGTETAFSLQDASAWLHDPQNSSHSSSTIQPISLWSHPDTDKLGASRSYTLTLSPHLIYSQSALLSTLVSSRLHTQIEFQAVGPWWICKDGLREVSQYQRQDNALAGSSTQNDGMLQKIPSTREDVFADNTLTPRGKRSLMQFLRSVVIEPASESAMTQDIPLSSTLHSVVPTLHQPLLALSLSYDSAGAVRTRSAVSRIRRHITSIGAFGPGFGAVMPKYGGGAEIAQVACRASAVGGAVYVLGRGLKKITQKSTDVEESLGDVVHLELSDGEGIQARLVTGCAEDFPVEMSQGPVTSSSFELVKTVHSISVVSSPLEHLFPPTSESGPVPAGAVVVYGGVDDHTPSSPDGPVSRNAPVYMVVHSADSGECPPGQCVLYSSTLCPPDGPDSEAIQKIENAVACLLDASPVQNGKPEVLWSLKYRTKGRPIDSKASMVRSNMSDRVAIFPPASIDPVFDDSILENVKEVWKFVMGDEVEVSDFMKFEERGGGDDDDGS